LTHMAVKIHKSSTRVFNLTPMIDCVFQLLIFFLVATRFAEEERELDVVLPQASEAQPITVRPRELVVNVDAEGRYTISGKALSLAELQKTLDALGANNPLRASVVVRADERCLWRFVVAAMNACLKAGIHDYRVTTREGPEE